MAGRRITPGVFLLLVFLLCGLSMALLQTYLFHRNADREIDLTFQDTDRILEQTEADTSGELDSYELIHAAKARMARYYIRNDEDTGYSALSMKNLRRLLDVENVYLVGADGRVVNSASLSSIDSFAEGDIPYFSQMQEIAGTEAVSKIAYFDVRDREDPETVVQRSFCAVSFTNGYFVVVEDDASGLLSRPDGPGFLEEVLPRITLGRNGFVFSVSWGGYVSAFSDEGETPIRNVAGLGIRLNDLKDGLRRTLVLQGDSYYCGVKYYSGQQLYVICAIPSGELTGNVVVVTAVPLFVVFVFLSLQLLYARQLAGGRLHFQRRALLLALSILFTVAASLYTQVLYAMYLQAQSNAQEADALARSLEQNEETQKRTSEEYYSDLENLTTLAARFISNNTEQITRRNLSDIARDLGAEHALLYDSSGEVILSDAYYKGMRLSASTRDLSYEFRKVLTGTPVLAQRRIDEDYLDQPYRYVGAIVTDENDELNGFVQLAFSPELLGSSLRESTVETLPSTFSGRNNAFAFIVDGAKKTFLYYPHEDLIDEPVADHGLTEEVLRDGYFSWKMFDGEVRLLYSRIWEEKLILTAASVGTVIRESLSRGIFISFAGIGAHLLFFFLTLLAFGRDKSPAGEKGAKEQAAAGRIGRLIRISFLIFTGAVSAVILLKDLLLADTGVMLRLLNGYWNTGVHVFSITACWIDVCIIYFAVSLVLLTLEMTGRLMNPRGKTIVRMLVSFLRYLSVIGAGFHCARLLGVRTDTLLASAGILTVVLGLGAQSLVTDILAGFFIIFEKAFKVGDIIRVGNESWRGRVLEIGIRNIRVMDMDENTIKIIHNSSFDQIVNLSDLPVFAYTTIGTEYGEDLERIEKILSEELPKIHERIPGAVEGPLYRGVSELGDSAVVLKFATQCRNEDFFRVRFAVNRELKLLFDRYHINVPFPQIVVNRREEGEA